MVNTISMSAWHGGLAELLERDAINELTETAIWMEGWI